MTIWIYSGRPSDGAALLAKEEGFRRLHLNKVVKPDDVIVNWGKCRAAIAVTKFRPLNQPGAVAKAVNKLMTFQMLAGKNIPTVPWTANKAVAKEWLASGKTVVARKTLTGHEGDGIVIVEPGNELIEAPLYTQYIFKEKEFRVHATPYDIIDTQQKVRDPKREVVSWKVRSWQNGFIFQRKNIIPSAKRDALAIQTIKALGLDFGGLDIIEDKKGDFYVLEANTAPGIEGTTVQQYGVALRGLAESLRTGIKPKAIAYDHKPAEQQAGPGLWVAAPASVAGIGSGIRNLNLGW